MTAKGINKIILLSHPGYDMNVEIAKEVSGIDLIVSGDTHYLLGSQFKEIGWNPVADYPTQITSKRNAIYRRNYPTCSTAFPTVCYPPKSIKRNHPSSAL